MVVENIEYIKFKTYKNLPPGFRSWQEATWTEDCFEKETVHFISIENARDLKFDPAKRLENLTGVKNVYFIKRTYFNRAIFKQMYPDIKIVNKPENADVVIYGSSQTKGAARDFAFGGTKLYNIGDKFALSERFMRKVRKKNNKIPTLSFYDPALQLTHYFLKTIYTLSDQQVDLLNCMSAGYAHIDTDTVFNKAELDFKQEDITAEDMVDIVKQLLSQNKDIMDAAISVVAQMDIEKYGMFMGVCWLLYRGAKTTRYKKCARFNMMHKPMMEYMSTNYGERITKYPLTYVDSLNYMAEYLQNKIQDKNNINYCYLEYIKEFLQKKLAINKYEPW